MWPWAFVIGLFGVVLSAAPAAAGLPMPPADSSSGKTGPHDLVDTVDTPGATCHYRVSDDWLDHIRVRPPVAYARQGHAHQKIGMRVVAGRFEVNHWAVVGKSAWSYKMATPSVSAQFNPKEIEIAAFDHQGDNDWQMFVAWVKLRWYAANGTTVKGAAQSSVHYYQWKFGSNPPLAPNTYCGPLFG